MTNTIQDKEIQLINAGYRALCAARVNVPALVKLVGEEKAEVAYKVAMDAVDAELAKNTEDHIEEWHHGGNAAAIRHLMTVAAQAAQAAVM